MCLCYIYVSLYFPHDRLCYLSIAIAPCVEALLLPCQSLQPTADLNVGLWNLHVRLHGSIRSSLALQPHADFCLHNVRLCYLNNSFHEPNMASLLLCQPLLPPCQTLLPQNCLSLSVGTHARLCYLSVVSAPWVAALHPSCVMREPPLPLCQPLQSLLHAKLYYLSIANAPWVAASLSQCQSLQPNADLQTSISALKHACNAPRLHMKLLGSCFTTAQG